MESGPESVGLHTSISGIGGQKQFHSGSWSKLVDQTGGSNRLSEAFEEAVNLVFINFY
jgi:hypothetical protein